MNLRRQGLSILCVDDDPQILRLLQSLLAGVGLTVEVAANGFNALALLKKRMHDFAVVITDLRMPGMRGTQLIEQARISGYTRPFIVFAGAIAPDDLQRLSELAVTSVLEKPARPGELIEAVRRATG
jgi:CheY-like chemotaxis protein